MPVSFNSLIAIVAVAISLFGFVNQQAIAQSGEPIKVAVIGGFGDNPQTAEVLNELRVLLNALSNRDLAGIGACLSPDITMLDSRTTQLIHGKDAVLAHVKKNVLDPADGTRIESVTVYDPFVTIDGDKAMVSFRAEKVMALPKPAKLESYCSEVYERKDGRWQILHMKNIWRPVR